MDEQLTTHCYVGIRSCGCRVAVIMDMPHNRTGTASTVADYIKSGYRIERESLEDFKANGMQRCSHD